MRITSKLIITIIIVSLMSMFMFEMAYNKIMYEDYAEIYNEVQIMEDRVNRLMEIDIKLTKYILEERSM